MAKINPIVIDVSHHNYDSHGPYNFNAARRWGVRGVIAKATEDLDYEDPTYEIARIGARHAGLLFGAYHFFRPGNVAGQVEHFLRVAWENDRERDTLLLCLDHEDEGCDVEDVKRFLELVEDRTGQRPVLYSGHLIKDQLGSRVDQELATTRLWLAQYGDDPETQASWDEYWLWQFTGDGEGPAPHSVPGIGDNIDISSWDGTYAELVAGWAISASEGEPDVPEYEVPAWLAVMRAMTGVTEWSGSGDNPWIMHMADAIAREYPHQAAYAAQYTGDDVAWCGLTVAYCMTLAGIEPVFGDTDTERWMWALAWADWPQSRRLDEPQIGCGVSMERDGGGHVCFFEGWDGNNILCRGGNQSDQVKLSSYDPSTVVAYFWPMERPRPTVSLSPTEIQWVQASLNVVDSAGLEVDGDAGPLTREAVSSFQQDAGIPPTGVPDFPTRQAIITKTALWNLNSIRRPRG